MSGRVTSTIPGPMARAFLFVLDSFGIGGAGDAARFGDDGSDTFGHIAQACAAGAADRDGLRSGPLRVPNMLSLGLGRAAADRPAASCRRRRQPMLLPAAFHGAARGDFERQGHAVRPLGDRRRAGALRLGLFPADRCRPSRRTLTAAIVARGQRARHPRRLPCLRHRDHRASSARSTSAPASRSATPRRIRCSRSPPMKRISASNGSTSSA